MAVIDKKTQDLFKAVLTNGKEYENKRRGVKRLQIKKYAYDHRAKDGFPALTLKKLNFKSVVAELIWFLRGDNDIEFLRKHGVNIWNKDAYNWYVKECEFNNTTPLTFKEFKKQASGSVGANYSVQWRAYGVNKIDQIKQLIDGMKKDIMGSRLIVDAWNPDDLDKTALPPCHTGFQAVGEPEKDGYNFDLIWGQRSVDLFLGLPFNQASYFILGEILGKMTGHRFDGNGAMLKALHFYDNQYQEAKDFCAKEWNKHPNCELKINYDLAGRGVDVFNELEPEHFELIGYESDEFVPVEMIAPKKI